MFHNGAIISLGTVRRCFDAFLHNMDLLDLCAHDKHLQRVKKEGYKEKFDICLHEEALY